MLPVRSAYYIKASLRRRFRAVIALELEKYAANSNNRFVAQTVAYVIHQVSPVYSFIHHFLRALSQSKLTPRYVLSSASPAMHPTLTAYGAVILHLPSDLALPFDVKSFPQKMNLRPWETYRSGTNQLGPSRQLLIAVPFRCIYHTTSQRQCQ